MQRRVGTISLTGPKTQGGGIHVQPAAEHALCPLTASVANEHGSSWAMALAFALNAGA